MTKIHHIINTHKQLIKSTQLYYLLLIRYYQYNHDKDTPCYKYPQTINQINSTLLFIN